MAGPNMAIAPAPVKFARFISFVATGWVVVLGKDTSAMRPPRTGAAVRLALLRRFFDIRSVWRILGATRMTGIGTRGKTAERVFLLILVQVLLLVGSAQAAVAAQADPAM